MTSTTKQLSDREALLKLLKKVNKEGFVKEIRYFKVSSPPPPLAVCIQAPRLHIMMNGSLKSRMGKREIIEKRGCLTFHESWSWNLPAYPAKVGWFGVIFNDTYTRFIGLEHRKHERTPRAPTWWHHTDRPIGSSAMDVLRSIRHLSDSEGKASLHLFRGLLNLLERELEGDGDGSSSEGGKTYRMILAYLQENYRRPINRDSVARDLGIHPNHLSRVFRQQGGKAFVDHLRELRMQHAVMLLQQSDMGITHIAERSGFGHIANFHRSFRQYFGTSPARFRESR